MSDNNYQEVIKNNKLFDGIPPQDLKFTFRSEQILRRKEGEIVFQKGDKSLDTFLIIAGRVKIKVYIENKSVKLNKTINDFFGEIEVLEDTYRRSAAVANTDCILYVLTKSDLRALLTENPEINDNIIAYNKVEIPELQLTINQRLLKEDTDKLYVTPLPENHHIDSQPEDTGGQERNELDNKRREIEKTAEMILEINGDEEEDAEDDFPEDENLQEETGENDFQIDDTVNDEFTAEENLPPDDETIMQENLEPEYYSETEPAGEITETENNFSELEEPEIEESASQVEEELPEDKNPGEEAEALAEEERPVEDIPPGDDSPEFEEEKSAGLDETLPVEDDLTQETSSESVTQGDIEFESADEYETTDEEVGDIKTENLSPEYDSALNEPVESANDVAGRIQEEIREEEELNDLETETTFEPRVPDQEEDTKWINLNPVETHDEIPDDLSEEEKLRYEAEEEKLKYDDTEINSERILNAIKKINSSLDKKSVYSGIVRESVKLTEAQAGILYRVDPVKNQLVTEIETEDGLVEAVYSISDGLTGLAAETGEIINVREPAKDFRYSEDVDSISGLAGSSIMCVPVKNGKNETIAVISLANSSSGKFSISDEEKISTLATHISQALLCLDGIDRMLDENKDIYLSTLTKFITDNIQTPVVTMKYYASQIKKKDVPQEVRTVLSVLMDQADSVVDFLHTTLAFTENRNSLKIEAFSLQEVMDDALGLLAEYVESRNVGLYKKVESSIKVKLDKRAFYQACHQIAKNACDAMDESGNIYITAKQSGDLVNIEFRDTGPGIPEEHKAQIFRPFKSFKKDKGTGLGLTIAQKIIRDHGGELTVESSPEKGATFIISLPVFDEY